MTATGKRRLPGVAGIGVTMIAAAGMLLSSSCHPAGTGSTGTLEARESIMKVDFSCDAGSRGKIQRWGKSGFSRGCYRDEISHGRWIAWEEGYLNIEGSYRDGKKHGEWIVFNRDGTIFVKIIFADGVKKGKVYL